MATGIFADIATKVNTHPEVENRLIFEFPSETNLAPISRECPFFENPKITESQSANLAKYDVLGRGGQFFGYTGAKSRTYNLEFYLSLPHIVNTATADMMAGSVAPVSKMDMRRAFFDKKSTELAMSAKTSVYEAEKQKLLAEINDSPYTPELINSLPDSAFASERALSLGNPLGAPTRESFFSSEYDLAASLGGYDRNFAYKQGMQMLLYWVDLIRVSVLNNSQQPTQGPPVIRIKFGKLYDYISCLATKYSLSWDERAGYDVVTLIPNRIKINLSLVQIQRNQGTSWNIRGGTTELAPEQAEALKNRHNEVLRGWEGFEGSLSWEKYLQAASPVYAGVNAGSFTTGLNI
jgi:hypothetical protein